MLQKNVSHNELIRKLFKIKTQNVRTKFNSYASIQLRSIFKAVTISTRSFDGGVFVQECIRMLVFEKLPYIRHIVNKLNFFFSFLTTHFHLESIFENSYQKPQVRFQ